MPDFTIHPASFRDPSGFIFNWKGRFFRQVNKIYSGDYDLLMLSGLCEKLVAKNTLISHIETDEIIAVPGNCYKTLLPEQIQFITYPYEWCFLQLKDAALLTLDVLKTAIEHGMIIKDATPYNIQFINGKPLFIDTLSFEKYDMNKAWVAYRQFCNMFLFPLYLEHYLKTDLQKTLIVYPDGIPVDITSRLLPLKSRTSLGVWLHVYLQNTVSRNNSKKGETENFNKKKLLNLIDHLGATVSNMRSRVSISAWNRYYDDSILSENYLREKENIVKAMLGEVQVKTALDIGANNGHFSKIIANKGIEVIAIDNDSATINSLYHDVKVEGTKNILPLIIDVANPSPATGFRNSERPSFDQRVKTDLVVALALVHHLVIGRNIPLARLAEWFASLCSVLIIEFVPREDEKVMQMLASRKDVFGDYTQDEFEKEFQKYFETGQRVPVPGTLRYIYLFHLRATGH